MCLCNPICSWKPCRGLHAADISCVNKNSIHPRKTASWSGLTGSLPKGGPFLEKKLGFFGGTSDCLFGLHLLFFPWHDKLGFFFFFFAGTEGGFYAAWYSTEAAFRSAEVVDVKEYEVDLEVTACRRGYSWACPGFFLAKQWHEILVKVLDGDAQCMCIPWFCRCLYYQQVLLGEILLSVMLA